MKTFLRENPTIAFGLGLPLLLVVSFLLVSGIPSLLVPSPQYDVLYATGYHNYQNIMQVTVVGEKVQVIHQGHTQGYQRPQIWRYNPNTGAVKEIAFILPPDPAPASNDPSAPKPVPQSTVIDVPELAVLSVDSSSIAPDGYEFSTGTERYSRNVFGGMFYSSRYRNAAVLKKDGRRIRLPNAGNRNYYGNAQFIGWVVEQ